MGAGDLLFVDTNLLLYALDPADAGKQQAAQCWMEHLWMSRTGRISWQVLHEFYANAVRKLKAPVADARKTVELLAEWHPMGYHLALVSRAWDWTDTASLAYWDALIVASAEALGCRAILSEDFQEGRKFGRLEVINPFHAGPPVPS